MGLLKGLTRKHLLYIAAGVIFVLYIVLLPHTPESEKQAPTKTGLACTPTKDLTINTYDSGVLEVVRYIKNQLNDPASYEAVEWSPILCTVGADYYYTVRHKYRAKNAFGGTITVNQVFYITRDAIVLRHSEYRD